MRLKDRIALVTGGARGIGLAIARALTAEGAVPVVADIDGDGARAAVATLDHRNGLALALNVADAESVAASIRAVTERYGRLDILVNNAGIGSSTPFLDVRLEDWNRTIAVNLTGAFLVAQAAARVMAGHGGGRIVNVTSPSGQRGGRGRAAYGASKAGLELLTKVMAVELAEHGITVNAIAPGPIETEMVRHAHDADTRAAYGRLIPMGRYGNPEDIGAAAVFLCSDESRYVHGHVLNVDGGFGGAGLMTGK
ncbi:SDR family NAD(P)-dependent oxidoreductase [Azospirillum argentinense]